MDDLLAAVLEIYIKEALHADNGKEIVHQHYDNHQAETKGQGQVKTNTQTTIQTHFIHVIFRFQKSFYETVDLSSTFLCLCGFYTDLHG